MEGLKKKNCKAEPIRGEIPIFVKDIQGFLTLCARVWVPTTGGVRQTVLEEVDKSKFSIHPGATWM